MVCQPLPFLIVPRPTSYRLFLSQVPLIAVAAILVILKMDLPPIDTTEEDDGKPVSAISRIRRIDFLGTITIAIAIVSAMLLLDMGGQKFPWISPYSLVLSLISIVFGISFIVTEGFLAPEPIFSLHLLRNKDVVLSYLIMALQAIAQVGMMFFVPLYFEVTANASTTSAGAHLVPAVVGNAIGGLIAGAVIHRTGRYKFLAICSGLIASITYLLLIFRWNGNQQTGWLESMEIIPGGLGTGLVQSVVFISMAAAVKPKEMAMSTSGLFLVMNVGIMIGITGSSAALNLGFRDQLRKRLNGPDVDEVSFPVISRTSLPPYPPSSN